MAPPIVICQPALATREDGMGSLRESSVPPDQHRQPHRATAIPAGEPKAWPRMDCQVRVRTPVNPSTMPASDQADIRRVWRSSTSPERIHMGMVAATTDAMPEAIRCSAQNRQA